jgi:hypothetical protein
MALVLKDRVRESTITAGTGTLTLDGAVQGFQGFSVIGNGNTTYYAIVDVTTGAWEVGVGTYTASGQTLSRDSVLESSNNGNLVNFSSNIKDVFCTYPAEQAVTLNDIQTLTNKTLTSPTISGGTINNASVGATTASTGAFTTLTSNSTTTLNGTTIPASKTLVDTDSAQTLTNKTISGANNTLSNIGNSSLTNSSITFGSTAQALGSTVSALNGVSIGATTPSTGSFTSLTNSGNLAFTGTGNRITGDFSNATAANRVAFQSSTVNGNTLIDVLPNGTGTQSRVTVFNNSDPTNASLNQIAATSGLVLFQSGITGTGTYLPMAFFTGGSERVRIDTSGNVGIGTSSPASSLHVSGTTTLTTSETATAINSNNATNTGFVLKYAPNLTSLGNNFSQPLVLLTNDTERMRITSAGNVGIGTSTPTDFGSGYKTLAVTGTSGGGVFRSNSTNVTVDLYAENSLGGVLRTATNHPLIFSTNSTERMRIDSSGNLLVGTTSAAGERFAVYNNSTSQVTAIVFNRATSGIATDIFQVQAVQSASSAYFLGRWYSGGSPQFAVRGDGVIFAQNTTVQSISDARTKENVRDADDGLQTVLGLRPVRFDFKEGFGNSRKNQLGFIAQEVEAVFPDAVDAAGEKDEQGEPYKSVGPGAMIPVLVKAIQELKAELDTVKAELATLKGTQP